MSSFTISTHPLVLHKMSYLRQPRPYVSFRDYANLMRELGMLLAVEATANLETVHIDASETPRHDIHPITDKLMPRYYPRPRQVLQHDTRPVIVAIVRSGLTMAEGVREIVPTPYMGHIGVYFDPSAGLVTDFMVTMPTSAPRRICIIVDPFVNSGSTALHAIRILREYGVPPSHIRFLAICMAHRGYEVLREHELAKEVSFFCGRIDGVSEGEDWMPDFVAFNERMFRTTNKLPLAE